MPMQRAKPLRVMAPLPCPAVLAHRETAPSRTIPHRYVLKWSGLVVTAGVLISGKAFADSSVRDAAPPQLSPHTKTQAPGPTAESLDSAAVRLLGTILPGNQQPNAAVVEDTATGARRVQEVGDAFYGGVVQSIERGRMKVAIGDTLRTFELPQGAVLNPSRPESNAFPASGEPRKRLRNRAFLPFLATALEPYKDGGVITGARIRKLRAIGSKRLRGFRTGDIIRAIDGEPITTEEVLSRIPQRMLEQPMVNLEIERKGQRFVLVYPQP